MILTVTTTAAEAVVLLLRVAGKGRHGVFAAWHPRRVQESA